MDDSASVRLMVGGTLRAAGYEVVEASDGEEALAYATQHEVDLVLADLYMPRMDGLSLIRQLRSLPAYRLTPLVLLTTESNPERKLEAKRAGATGWIVKPFKPSQLLQIIERAVGSASISSAAVRR